MVDDKPKTKAKPKPKSPAKTPASKDVSVTILCKSLFDGEQKYSEGQTYTVSKKWSDSVIKSDKTAGRDPRIKLA